MAKLVDSFTGSKKNEITSESMQKQGKAYTFFKVEEICPAEINKAVDEAKNKFFLQDKSSTILSHKISHKSSIRIKQIDIEDDHLIIDTKDDNTGSKSAKDNISNAIPPIIDLNI